MKEYVAHKSDDGRLQTVSNHNRNVATLAAKFADVFGYADEAYQIGLVHDIGKTSVEFQDRILNDGQMCDHSAAGAYELAKVNDLIGSMAVLGHHTGLPDLGSRADDLSEPTWHGRMKRADRKFIPGYECHVNLKQRDNVNLDFSTAFLVRMLYSCLVDADFLDTEAFMEKHKRKYEYDSIPMLLGRFYGYIGQWSSPKSEMHKIRSSILYNCLNKGSVGRGLYSLTVPTGGGKTTASLGFALQHASQHNMQRVIYIVPYTSIIEQNSQVFRDAVGAYNVLEHHAGYDGHGSDEFSKEQLAAENWDAPVVVTTAVRFFEALFASKSSKCRRLHNIADSVLIFDEAQLLPAEHLIPCTRVIRELVSNYRCTAVLCTATCPVLDEFFDDMSIVELQTDKKELYEVLRRTHVKVLEGKHDVNGIADMMRQHKQVLCIVNTRQAARDVYEALPEEGRYHLSTLMYPAHRRKILDEIKTRLSDKKTVRLVSTSLIEAGVDISFPIVFREYSGLDSVLQAAGRCNREGEESADESPVYVFERDGKSSSMLSKTIGAFREVMIKHASDMDSLDSIENYFHAYHRFVGHVNMDRDNAVGAFEQHNPCPLPFRTVSEQFHFIHEDTWTVYVMCDGSRESIERVRNGYGSRDDYRLLGQYSVSLYASMFERMYRRGHIQVYGDSFAVVDGAVMYSEDTGLILDKEMETMII